MAEKDQVRIHLDRTISKCTDCPFLDWHSESTQYYCRGKRYGPHFSFPDDYSFQLIYIDNKNFVIPQNCPFRNQEGE